MKADFEVGTLLICVANEQAHLITNVRETNQAEYGRTKVKRKEYEVFGSFPGPRSRGYKERRWVCDYDLRVKYYLP